MQRSLAGAAMGAVIFALLVNVNFAHADPESQDNVPPQNIAQAAQLTREILHRYRLASPPDLNPYGLQLSPDGAYMKSAGAGTAVWASRQELAEAMEHRLLDSYEHMAREDADRWLSAELRARLPQEEAGIAALDTPAKALLLQSLIDNPDAKIKGTLALFSSRLNQAKDGTSAAGILDEMFVGVKVFEPVQLGNLIHNPTNLRLSLPAHVALRNAADLWANVGVDEFKPPGTPSLKTAAPPSVIITNLQTASSEELYFLLGELKKRDQADIRRLKEELLRLANFEDSHVREGSVYLLGLLRDESLVQFFADKLRDQEVAIRDDAARAMGVIMASIHLKEGWPGFIKKVPSILSTMVLSDGDQNPFYENGRMVRSFMSYVNLMEEKQKKEFIAGFNKPAAIAIILAMSRGEDINERGGLHTPEGRQLYSRLKELSAKLGLSLSRVLDDPAVNQDTRARFLVRANRYQVLEDAVRTDPTLPGLAIANLFVPSVPERADAIFSACQAIENVYHDRFYDAALQQLPSLPSRTQARVIIYLKMRENNMRPEQRERLEENALRVMPQDFFARVNNDDITPPYYKAWPKDVLNVALVMTQEAWARDFENAARADGYRLAANNPKDFQRQGRCLAKKVSQKEIRIFLATLPSNSKGWALDKDGLARILKQSFSNDNFQVIAYRGHSGDYNEVDLFNAKNFDAKNKVFIDLACDSANTQEDVIQLCRDCGFYGTLTTSQGVVNNRFLLLVLDGLARTETHHQTRQRLAQKLPANSYKFTGSWSPGTQFQIYCDAYDKWCSSKL